MSFIAVAHDALWRGLFVLEILLGLWALVLGTRARPIGGSLFSGLLVDEGLIIVQSILGGVLFAAGHRPQPLHFLYGALLLSLLPIVYSLTSRKPERAGIWIGLTLLFMAGLVLRALTTGRA